MKLPFIEAGEIVTTHGVRGEMKILTWLDSPRLCWILIAAELTESSTKLNPAGCRRPAIC